MLTLDRERCGEAPTSAYLDGFTGITKPIGFRCIIGVISCDEFGDCGTGRVQITRHTDSRVTGIAGLPVVYSYAP